MGITIGVQAPELVLALAQLNSRIETLTFATYYPEPGLEQRLAESADIYAQLANLQVKELKAKKKDNMPYWESVLSANWSLDIFKILIKEALRHDVNYEVNRRTTISAKDLTRKRMVQIIESLSGDAVIALCSICQLDDGTSAHIPMMDFRCAPNEYNLARVKLIIEALGLSGCILESGKSYHFYGLDLFDQDEWLDFMSKSLLLAPFTDTRYVAHRVLGGTGVLRISANSMKQMVPFIREIVTTY